MSLEFVSCSVVLSCLCLIIWCSALPTLPLSHWFLSVWLVPVSLPCNIQALMVGSQWFDIHGSHLHQGNSCQYWRLLDVLRLPTSTLSLSYYFTLYYFIVLSTQVTSLHQYCYHYHHYLHCTFSILRIVHGHTEMLCLFECSTRHITQLLHSLVRHWVEHSKRFHISKDINT